MPKTTSPRPPSLAAHLSTLGRAEHLLAEAEEIGHMGAWEFDIDTQEQAWTDGVRRIHEVDSDFHPTVADGIGFYTPESRPVIQLAVQRAIERGEPFDVELEIVTAKGNRRAVRAIGARDPEGRRVHGFFQDVTERTRAKQALERTDRRYRSILQSAIDGFAVLDMQGRLLDVNAAYARMLGYSETELRQLTVADLEAIETAEELRAHIARIHTTGADRFETQQRRKDGSLIDLEVSVHYRDIEQPELICFVRDITQRKQAEQALRQAREVLRKSARLAQIGGWELDVDTLQLYWSEETFRIHGLDLDFTPTVANAISRYLPEHAPVISAAVTAAIEHGTPFDLELAILTPQGECRDVRAVGDAERVAGRTVKVRGVFQDITVRKATDAELVKMQKLDSLGTLAGGIAHDFNNILTSILGNLSLLRGTGALGEDAEAMVKEASDACMVARGLAHQLLTFAKGGQPVMQKADLRPLLREAAAFASRGTTTRCVLLLPEQPLAVQFDKDQIAQVVQNLVLNATQAMPSGGEIAVRADLVDLADRELPPLAAGRYVRLSVTDQGVGIDPSHLPRIFDPYFTTKTAGRGLGLAVCHSIIARHGGDIRAESQLGRGTTIVIHLRALDEWTAAPALGVPTLLAGRGRVLVMDDDRSICIVLERMLRRLGFQVQTVDEGQAALAAYTQAAATGRPFDAVIMDLTIPGGMGGKATIAELRALDPAVKAIVASGYAQDRVLADYREHGFAAVLAKPFTVEEVSAALAKVLGEQAR